MANVVCVTGGVKQTDSLLFTCKIYRAFFLRVVLPTGYQEVISVGDTVDDVVLPTGFTAVSLEITDVDYIRANFKITISTDRASHLAGRGIRCDDTTSYNVVKAACPLGKPGHNKICTTVALLHNFKVLILRIVILIIII